MSQDQTANGAIFLTASEIVEYNRNPIIMFTKVAIPYFTAKYLSNEAGTSLSNPNIAQGILNQILKFLYLSCVEVQSTGLPDLQKMKQETPVEYSYFMNFWQEAKDDRENVELKMKKEKSLIELIRKYNEENLQQLNPELVNKEYTFGILSVCWETYRNLDNAEVESEIIMIGELLGQLEKVIPSLLQNENQIENRDVDLLLMIFTEFNQYFEDKLQLILEEDEEPQTKCEC